jgi:hypothetical protein
VLCAVLKRAALMYTLYCYTAKIQKIWEEFEYASRRFETPAMGTVVRPEGEL